MNKILAANLKMKRLECRLTQKAVQKILGLGEHIISNFENAISDPDTETLNDLAKLYNTTADFLLNNKITNGVEEKMKEIAFSKTIYPNYVYESELWKKYQDYKAKEEAGLICEEEYYEYLADEATNIIPTDPYKAIETFEDLLCNGYAEAYFGLLSVQQFLDDIYPTYDNGVDRPLSLFQGDIELALKYIIYNAIYQDRFSDYASDLLGDDYENE